MRHFKGVSGLGVGIFVLVLAVFLVVGNQAGLFAGMFAAVPFGAPCDPLVTPNLLCVG